MNSKRLQQLIDDAAKNIAEMPYGATIPHELLKGWLECESEGAYDSRIRRVKDALIREYGRFLEAEPTVGYKILHPNDAIYSPETHIRRALRAKERAVYEYSNMRCDEMSAAARTYVIDRGQAAANLLAMEKAGYPAALSARSQGAHP